jgi:hypothetical protein
VSKEVAAPLLKIGPCSGLVPRSMLDRRTMYWLTLVQIGGRIRKEHVPQRTYTVVMDTQLTRPERGTRVCSHCRFRMLPSLGMRDFLPLRDRESSGSRPDGDRDRVRGVADSDWDSERLGPAWLN